MTKDTESLNRFFDIEFTDDAAMIHRTIHRPQPSTRHCFTYDEIIGACARRGHAECKSLPWRANRDHVTRSRFPTVSFSLHQEAPMPLATDPASVQTPVQAPTAEYVQIPVAELARLQATSAQLEAHRQAAAYQEAAAKTKLLATQGQIDTVLQQHQRELESERQRTKQLAVSAELAKNLATYQLADPQAASQLAQLLSPELSATEGAAGFEVRIKRFQKRRDFVKEKLSHRHFPHFLAPDARQAAGTQQTPGRPPAQAEPAKQPSNLGEALIMDALNRQSGTTQVDPRMTGGYYVPEWKVCPLRSAAFGLKPKR